MPHMIRAASPKPGTKPASRLPLEVATLGRNLLVRAIPRDKLFQAFRKLRPRLVPQQAFRLADIRPRNRYVPWLRGLWVANCFLPNRSLQLFNQVGKPDRMRVTQIQNIKR